MRAVERKLQPRCGDTIGSGARDNGTATNEDEPIADNAGVPFALVLAALRGRAALMAFAWCATMMESQHGDVTERAVFPSRQNTVPVQDKGRE